MDQHCNKYFWILKNTNIWNKSEKRAIFKSMGKLLNNYFLSVIAVPS